jgi:hypothetical protein
MDRTTVKLSRKTLESAAKELPIEAILGKTVSGGLTHKQKNFARAIAMGATKADAYRASYNVTSEASVRNDPYRIAADPRIAREIEAYTLAIEAEKHRTPAALRSLVIQGLVQVALDADTKDSVKVQALKTLGTVTEVAAFTERKEVRSITSSDDARARVMQELRGLLTAQAQDATVIEADADSLLRELAGDNIVSSERDNIVSDDADNIVSPGESDNIASPGASEEPGGATPPYPDPPDGSSGVPRP